MSDDGTDDDKRKCAVCGGLLRDAHAKGETSTTLTASHSGATTHICSRRCWDAAMRKLGLDA